MPRISISVWLGPSLFSETPGVPCAKEAREATPRASKSLPLTAEMLIGVSCTVDARFDAVTTISSREAPALSAVTADSAFTLRARDTLRTPARAVPATTRLNRLEFLSEIGSHNRRRLSIRHASQASFC